VEDKEFDLVAVGRALLQDPAWVKKVEAGATEELQDFDRKSLATLY
jgi:2,4-dienoyl-CoA reductase-like NADH-dependent reductase (Old Yellow Enzyme family)